MSENTENQGTTRRAVVKGAAWAVPVIAVSVATPLAAASGEPEPCNYVCRPRNPYDGDVQDVLFNGLVMTVIFKASAQNTVDVTVRIPGYPEIHYNLAREDRYVNNGQAHEKPYKAGGSFTINLPVPFDKDRDYLQVQTIHAYDCVAV